MVPYDNEPLPSGAVACTPCLQMKQKAKVEKKSVSGERFHAQNDRCRSTMADAVKSSVAYVRPTNRGVPLPVTYWIASRRARAPSHLALAASMRNVSRRGATVLQLRVCQSRNPRERSEPPFSERRSPRNNKKTTHANREKRAPDRLWRRDFRIIENKRK